MCLGRLIRIGGRGHEHAIVACMRLAEFGFEYLSNVALLAHPSAPRRRPKFAYWALSHIAKGAAGATESAAFVGVERV
jgi:hypothetical protein